MYGVMMIIMYSLDVIIIVVYELSCDGVLVRRAAARQETQARVCSNLVKLLIPVLVHTHKQALVCHAVPPVRRWVHVKVRSGDVELCVR